MNKYFSLLYFIIILFKSQLFFGQKSLLKKEISNTISNTKALKTKQMIIAYTDKKDSSIGKLYAVEYINNKWQVTFDTIQCSIGRKGFADFDKKIEGDGKTPSGKFQIGNAFGYKDDLITKMDFIELNENHYWVSDTSSELYNKLIEFNPRDTYSEKMKRNDHLYKYGIVIEYNTQKVVKGKGSAIFIHIVRRIGAPTAGCIAVSEEKMKELIRWIKPQKNPEIIMGSKTLVSQYMNQ